MGYTKKAVFGFGWLGVLKGIVEVSSITKIIILSRVLSPSDFGIFGLTIASLSLVERFTETGVNTFLIQKKESLQTYINSAWLIALVRGSIIGCVLLLSSKFLPSFYNTPSLAFFLLVSSLVPFIKGAINPAIVTFWKNMDYNKEALFRGFLTLFEAGLSIVFTLMLKSPIGLIYAMVCAAIAEVLLSHALIHPRPSLRGSKQRVIEILHASKWLNIGTIFNFLVTTVDNLIVGKILGVEQLGYYQNAYNVTSSTTGDLGDLASQIVFPIFSRIRDDRKRLGRALFRSLAVFSVVAAIPALLVSINPSFAVQLVLGEKWLPIVPLLPILFIAMYIRAINAVMYPVFLSVERPERNVFILGVHVVALVGCLVPLTIRYGLMGAAVAVLLSYTLIQPLFALFIHKTLREKA